MIETRLDTLGCSLPEPFVYPKAMTGVTRHGSCLFVSGVVPLADGALRYQGRLGEDCSVEAGYEAARLCALNSLALIKQAIGDLEQVTQVLKVNVYVNSKPGFSRQPEVANGASDLLVALFGERGLHARTAVGVADLPMQAPVEVEMTVAIAGE